MILLFCKTISTFAWFSASADVEIEASTSSTTITVNRPDSYAFYAYRGITNSNHVCGETDGDGDGNAGEGFEDDFIQLETSEQISAYTNLSGMNPGDSYPYCLGITAASKVSINITKVISNNTTKEGISPARYIKSGENRPLANIGWAIDIFVDSKTPANNALPTGYSTLVGTKSPSVSYPDKFNYDVNNSSPLNGNGDGNPNYVITLAGTGCELYTNNSLTTTNDLYLFFSIVYSEASKSKFVECTNGSNTEIYEPPTSISSSAEIEIDRYFTQSGSGNSNCFGGLKFGISEINVNITK